MPSPQDGHGKSHEAQLRTGSGRPAPDGRQAHHLLSATALESSEPPAAMRFSRYSVRTDGMHGQEYRVPHAERFLPHTDQDAATVYGAAPVFGRHSLPVPDKTDMQLHVGMSQLATTATHLTGQVAIAQEVQGSLQQSRFAKEHTGISVVELAPADQRETGDAIVKKLTSDSFKEQPDSSSCEAGLGSRAPRQGLWLALARNSWVLAIMAGILAILCVGSPRLHEHEAGKGWHAVSQWQPFEQQLQGSPPYISAAITLPPWESEALGADGVLVEAAAKGYRRSRSLLQAMGLGLYSDTPGATSRQSLMRGQLRHRGGLRALLAGIAEGESQQGSEEALPYLEVFLAQVNVSHAAGGPVPQPGGGLHPLTRLTGTKRCTWEAELAVDCFLEWKGVDRVDEGSPMLLVAKLHGASQAAAYVHVVQLGGLGAVKEYISLVILIAALIGIATEKVHRMWCAWLAAFLNLGLLLLCNSAPDMTTVVSWIDYGTLGLLFGMMVIVGQLKKTGFFEAITAFVSAWLDNVTTMLLMGPMTISVYQTLDRDPVPLLVGMALMSNVGGTATMIGDPPNIIIGNELRAEVGFMDFITNLAPGVIAASIATIAWIIFQNRKQLTGRLENYDRVLQQVSTYKIEDWDLMAKAGYVTGFVVLMFLLHPLHHINPAWPALLGALVLCLVVNPEEIHEAVESVEWDMLMFFAGMFIMVEASVELGLIRRIASVLRAIIESAPASATNIAAIEILLWFSAIFSAMLDNIPYTITLIPVIKDLAASGLGLSLTTLTWALSFGACLGGNGTLIGASANIVTAGLANRAGYKITFVYWLKLGIPSMIVSVAVVNAYMLARYSSS